MPTIICCYYLPTKAVGKLIGPQGITIRGITEETGARIDTSRCDREVAFGVLEVAASTDEALEACRRAIELVVGFSVSSTAPCRVQFDLRSDSALLGKLRGNKYELANRVKSSCRLMELEVPGRDNGFECVAAVGGLDDCLRARDMLAAELQLGSLAHAVVRLGADLDGPTVATAAAPPERPPPPVLPPTPPRAQAAGAPFEHALGPERVQIFYFPDRAVGKLIGPQGTTIKALCAKSESDRKPASAGIKPLADSLMAMPRGHHRLAATIASRPPSPRLRIHS